MDFLRDPIWQFIGAFLALIALFVSIYLFILQRRKKTLAYEILSETELLTMKEGFEGKVQILFEGQNVENVHLLVLKVINNGNIPIASSDFENALTFIFGKDGNILSAEIIDTSPKTLKPTFTANQNKLILNPTLLNSGDIITFKLLLTQYDGEIEVDTRIIGVSEVKKATEQRTQSMYISVIGGVISIISIIALFSTFPRPAPEPATKTDFREILPKLPFFAAFLFGYIMMFYGTIRSMKFRRAFKKYISKGETETKN